jgi:hypothetical protein
MALERWYAFPAGACCVSIADRAQRNQQTTVNASLERGDELQGNAEESMCCAPILLSNFVMRASPDRCELQASCIMQKLVWARALHCLHSRNQVRRKPGDGVDD